MVLPDYYDYINILAFEYLYKYENKKSISIETLHKFRKTLLEIVLDEYKEKKNIHFSEEDQWEGEVSFTPIQEKEKLKEFLNTYEDYFYLDKNMVILKEEITYDQIEQLEIDLQRENKIPHRLTVGEDEVKLLQLLGIHTIENMLREYVKIEEKLEEKYNELYTQKDNSILRKDIQKLLNNRILFYVKLSTLSEKTIDAFRLIVGRIDEETIYNYNKMPIDLDIVEESEYFNKEDIFDDIDDRIYSIYQYAIFGNDKANTMCTAKLEEDITNQFFSIIGLVGAEVTLANCDTIINFDIMNNYGIEDTNDTQNVEIVDDLEDWIFNITYIDKLNKYMEKHGENESLLSAKRRLLYALDKPGKKIFIEENFERELQNLDFDEIDEDSFEFFQDEYFFLADEVFETEEDENTVKKILLISTYYDLTKNEEIKEIVESHKEHEKYDQYCEVIFGEEKGKVIQKQK